MGALLSTFILVLCACGKVSGPNSAGGKPPSEEIDKYTCAATSKGQMAETENGYYAQFWDKLYYADKADLTNWVLVCNEPNCIHWDDRCPANLGSEGFWLRENRIYTLRNTMTIDARQTAQLAIYSMALDGTDLRMEYPLDVFPKDCAVMQSNVWMADGLYLSSTTLEKDGSYRYHLGRLDKDGMHTLHEAESLDWISTAFSRPWMLGDSAVRSEQFSGGGEEWNKHLYRETENGFEEIPGICEYKLSGAYLHGDVLYHFIRDDGYYCTNLRTGNSEKWMDAQLKDSWGTYLGTDILLETNMATSSNPAMRIYRSGEWKSVTLPENIWPGDNGGYVERALTMEHLFFYISNRTEEGYRNTLYAIDLSDKELTATLCGEFRSEFD